MTDECERQHINYCDCGTTCEIVEKETARKLLDDDLDAPLKSVIDHLQMLEDNEIYDDELRRRYTNMIKELEGLNERIAQKRKEFEL